MDLLTLALLKKNSSGGGSGETAPLLQKITANTQKIEALSDSVASIEQKFSLYPTKKELENGEISVLARIATSENTGVVKGSDETNKVSVNDDGTMTVNNVSVNKLVQDDDEFIIMDGGTADAFL